jgi:hypothetical protein
MAQATGVDEHVGRERELDELAAFLDRSGGRALVLEGDP